MLARGVRAAASRASRCLPPPPQCLAAHAFPALPSPPPFSSSSHPPLPPPPPTCWVDRVRPAWLAPLLRLSRADRPAGTLLLLSPCLWSLALASPPGSLPPAGTVALFAAGAVLLRGAGCTLNDLADSDVDAAVARTRARPLPSGQVSHAAAAAWCAAQLGAGAGVLLALPPRCFFLGLAALPLVAAYPLAKRVTHWPQALLGVCFAWGVPMGGAAVGPLDPAATLPLFAAAWAWTMVFDTLYAHQDARDDAAAGVHSTALRFGEQTPAWLAGFSALMVASLAAAGSAAGLGGPFYAGVAGVGCHLAWQVGTVDLRSPADCASKFASNAGLGLAVAAAVAAGRLASGG